jgi:hypothetical protein
MIKIRSVTKKPRGVRGFFVLQDEACLIPREGYFEDDAKPAFRVAETRKPSSRPRPQGADLSDKLFVKN